MTQRQILIMACKCFHRAKMFENASSFIPKLQKAFTVPIMEDLQLQHLVTLSYFS